MADETYTGVMVALLPAENDPITAASSEPAHLTLTFLGDSTDLDPEELRAAMLEIEAYATDLDGPLVMPVESIGGLGDEGAVVAFLEKSDAAVALRQGAIDGAATVRKLAEQNDRFLGQWRPHVTLSYPDRPANAEYAGETVTFDRIAVWIGDEHHDFDMGGTVGDQKKAEKPEGDAILAAARSTLASYDMAGIIGGVDDEISDEMPPDELEEGEELVTEIPVHGVAAIEGRATGDGRGFRPGALTFGTLPQPLGYEFEHGHGAANSRVAIVGRIDEYWTVETEEPGVFEARWRGVIFPHKEWGARAIESILDGSYTGVSIVPDSVTVDVEEAREKLRERIVRDQAETGGVPAEVAALNDAAALDADGIELLLDTMIGDGKMETTWYSEARVRRFDMVPTGAFIEGYTALGAEFADDMTPDQIEASAAALADCGCADSLNQAEAIVASAAGTAPGLKADGTPPKCKYGDEPATQYVLHSEGMAYVPTCDEHLEQARTDAAATTPDGEPDPSNIDRIGSYAAQPGSFIIVFDSRSDEGPLEVGPFESREDADAYVGTLTGPGFDASWEVHQLTEPRLVASAFAPGTKDGPGWITHPIPTSRIRRYWVSGKGAAKIRWGVSGDFNRCRAQLAKYVQNPEWLAGLCANMHKEALGVWPGQEGGGRGHSLAASAAPMPLYSLLAAAAPVDAGLFANPNLEGNVGIVVEGERVFGYIALWNVCHIGQPDGPGSCTLAPRSATNYAHFRTGTVITTEGPIAVGSITMNTGHAGGRLTPAATAAHYDNTGTVVADVACGDDRYGIWYSGRKRPGVSDEDIYAAMASGRVSGDWRKIGGTYELMGALVVNVAGYPIPNASLVASADLGGTAIIGEGIVPLEAEAITASAAASEAITAMSSEEIAGIALAAVEAYVAQQERSKIIADVAPARGAVSSYMLADARGRLATLTQE